MDNVKKLRNYNTLTDRATDYSTRTLLCTYCAEQQHKKLYCYN